MDKLIEMLQWKRPSRSLAAKIFGKTFLEPVFGPPDQHGNYVKILKDDDVVPNICFAAHYDTVHDEGGFQEVTYHSGFLKVEDSDCLGADCTTGVWLILEMIDANIPGVYVIHADEEAGCIGSSALVKDHPEWIDHVDAVISFDRYGTNSVITHQVCGRTASDAFAESFAEAVNMPQLKPDDGGVYTDSNEYVELVSECTNISVGYYAQHTSKESQNVVFLEHLRDSLIAADWSKLVFERTPGVDDTFRWGGQGSFYRYDDSKDYNKRGLRLLVDDYPEEVVEWLDSYGISFDDLASEANVDIPSYLIDNLELGIL